MLGAAVGVEQPADVSANNSVTALVEAINRIFAQSSESRT
jgi:hypothetical protein